MSPKIERNPKFDVALDKIMDALVELTRAEIQSSDGGRRQYEAKNRLRSAIESAIVGKDAPTET